MSLSIWKHLKNMNKKQSYALSQHCPKTTV